MKNYQDLESPLDMTLPHVRKFTGIVNPGVKLFTDEQVQHLIEIRAEMKAGRLTWKELEAKYAAPEETEPKHEPPSDSAIQQAVEKNVGELKHKIRQVSTRVMGSMIAKDATDLVSNLPYLTLGAGLHAMNHSEKLMAESYDIVDRIIKDEPSGNYENTLDAVAQQIDSAYEQGRRITGTSYGDYAALEAAKEEEEED